jgi:outer membrane biosynthesis protein TonB
MQVNAIIYRTYQLPWEMAEEQDERFRALLKKVAIAALVFCLLMPWLPVPDVDPNKVAELPPRFARLLLEKAPPPPPPPVVQPKPEDKPIPKEAEKVVQEAKPEPVQPKQEPKQARETAAKAGLLPFAEQLADLRDNAALENVLHDDSLSASAGEAARVERSVIASKAGRGSGGVNTSGMSRNTGGSGLAGRGTTQVSSPVAGIGAGGPRVSKGGAGPSRSREEIELVFEKNKGAIFSLYNRALRRDPTLQGKLVLRLTISPSGAVTACEIDSSELNDPEMERKLVQRVKMFRFMEKDVATVTTTKPIDFFPA